MKIRMGFVSNSSSSSFICRTDLDPVQVEAKLIDLLSMYNDFMDKDLKFKNVFRKPFVADASYRSDFFEGYKSDHKGSVVIESAMDNSIPEELYELIEDKFNATRYYLG